MNFESSQRCKEFQERLRASWTSTCTRPSRCTPSRPPDARTSTADHGGAEGRGARRGLWNLFLPDAEHGAGLTNLEYAPLAEIMGRTQDRPGGAATAARRTPATWRCCTSSAPTEQKERWLRPLLDGEIRSGVRDDRAGGRVLGRDQHRDADRARRRRLRPQRPQVVDDQRACTPTADPDRDGQDRTPAPHLSAAVDDPRARSTPRA